MALVREAIPILKDLTSKAGAHLSKVIEGQINTGVFSLSALVAKKRSDNTLSYISVNDLGQVIVETSPDIEARLWQEGKVVDSALNVASTIATIPLLTNKVYRGIAVQASCGQLAQVNLVWNNNGVNKVIQSVILDGAKKNENYEFQTFEMTSGLTGTQELKLVGTVIEGIATDLIGYLSTTEIQDT